ncbi:hypothetical protein CPB84DRAFT_1784520 [Gymnopilus junonius]|uniref:RING-type domain-containing protein n=1 Tax=Gymnopilus junonius TaxID=109634 RepID=A0A9P5NJK6_GYMJU|nr:hypothetical protein CPB84DRAFT_1784520 [Gymnopilus junonius]
MSFASSVPSFVDHGIFIDNDLDFETSALIVKLALEDLDEVLNRRKGKSRADSPLTDEEYAHQVQYEHYRQLLAIAEDAKVAKSIADAVATDGAYVDALMTAELAAADDRRAAEMLARGEALPPPNATQSRLEDRAFIMHPDPSNVAALDYDDEDSSDTETVVSDATVLPRASSGFMISKMKPFQSNRVNPSAGPSVNRNKMVNCTICFDNMRYVNALHTQCGHHYCRDCVKDLVENFTRDESLFPLRCCQQPLQISIVIPFISAALRALFEEKHAELFLGSSRGTDSSSIICLNQASHEGDDCIVNAATIELRALAQQEGWQTCPGCQTLIELNLGCYHMTCRCRTQFCYLCAERWKNCTCPRWDENRLLAAAQQRVENELGPQAAQNVAPAVIERQVQERVQTMRNDRHCDRHSWTRRNGGGMCEECNCHLRDFLLICRHCSILACVRCSRNRF